MLYREDLCIRDSVNCPTNADWSNHPGKTVGESQYNAQVEYWQPSEDPRSHGRPQFHRQILTTADVERLNEYLNARHAALVQSFLAGVPTLTQAVTGSHRYWNDRKEIL